MQFEFVSLSRFELELKKDASQTQIELWAELISIESRWKKFNSTTYFQPWWQERRDGGLEGIFEKERERVLLTKQGSVGNITNYEICI